MLVIRPELPEDVTAIHRVNEQAFGQENEAILVDRLRSRGVLTVSLVAVQDREIVGHIAFSPVNIEPKQSSFRAVALAPMAVLPDFQNKGIGSQLVRSGLEECRHLGYGFVVLVGHPELLPTLWIRSGRT